MVKYDKKFVICLNYGHFEKNWDQWSYFKITISTKSMMSIPFNWLDYSILYCVNLCRSKEGPAYRSVCRSVGWGLAGTVLSPKRSSHTGNHYLRLYLDKKKLCPDGTSERGPKLAIRHGISVKLYQNLYCEQFVYTQKCKKMYALSQKNVRPFFLLSRQVCQQGNIFIYGPL